MVWTFSQFTEAFYNHHLARLANVNKKYPLSWNNVMIPTTGGGNGTTFEYIVILIFDTVQN